MSRFTLSAATGPQPGDRMAGRMVRSQPSYDAVDQLAATLEPLRPKVFEVETPEQLTRALKEVRSELLTLDGSAH